jgi:NAD+ diphosphatase
MKQGRLPEAEGTFAPGFDAEAKATGDALVIAAHDLSIVVIERDGALALPDHAEIAPHIEEPAFVGRLGSRPVFAAALRVDAPAAKPSRLPAPLSLVSARRVLFTFDVQTIAAVGQVVALAEWRATSRFCGRCATPTAASPTERVFTCPACKASFRPRVPPAVIVLVERGDSVLLARSPGFPPNMFGLVAGFVEPGESLEQAAQREVLEEVGLEIEGLVYAGSQPWQIGRSLMVGFRARSPRGDLALDPREIEEAAFYARDAMPGLPPGASIARNLIDAWLAERVRA